jgi:predicted acetyltransferase
MSSFEYDKIADSGDAEKLKQILNQCFIDSSEEEEKFFQAVGLENFRIIRQNGEIAGGLSIIPFSQWWGGECMPMSGIAAVGIAPEYRGSGAALALMQNTVREMYARGVSISTLFPAVQKLYRKVGYEQAGSFCNWEVKTENIQIHKSTLPITAIDVNPEILEKLYQKQASLNNGNLARNPFIWGNIFQNKDLQPLYTYLIGASDNPQGYVVFTQKRTDTDNFVQIHDWVVLTSEAMQSFWSFLAGMRSQIDTIRWRGGLIDPITLVLPEQTAKLKSSKRWMLRIVDVVKALEKRGYPQNLQAELHLEIEDDLIETNNGKYIVSVANGRCEVIKGGKGELKLDIRDLAPLYTGLYSASQLQLMGRLKVNENTNTNTKTIAIASQIFAGISPWMADFF